MKNLWPVYILLPYRYMPSTMVFTTRTIERTIEISGVLFSLDEYYFEDDKLIEEVVDHAVMEEELVNLA